MAAIVRVLLLLGLVLGAAPAHAQYEDDYGYAEEDAPGLAALDPYGTWLDDPGYGRVWRPAVGAGWAPYVDGSWTWTPYGWTWVSSEPWSWTFHYGRWAPAFAGWVWVPGSVWGPAWVDWYWGDGFVGWAPLAPFALHVSVLDRFVFVHERDFCSRGLSGVVLNHDHVPGYVVDRWHRRDWRYDRGPDPGRIERVSRFPVRRYERRPPGTSGPGRGGHRFVRSGSGMAGAPARSARWGRESVWGATSGDRPRAQRLGRPRPNPYGGGAARSFTARDFTADRARGRTFRASPPERAASSPRPSRFRAAPVPRAPARWVHGGGGRARDFAAAPRGDGGAHARAFRGRR